MHNRDLFDAEPNIAAKVDLLRYEIVHHYGGVYLDADTRSLGPGSLERMTHAFVTVSGPPWYNTGNAQFGFAKGSEFLDYVIGNARDSRVRARPCLTERTGPTFLTTCVLSFGDMRIVHPNGRGLLEKVHHLAEKNW
jgi:mannosyltransferase OCH1-like enzyme